MKITDSVYTQPLLATEKLAVGHTSGSRAEFPVMDDLKLMLVKANMHKAKTVAKRRKEFLKVFI